MASQEAIEGTVDRKLLEILLKLQYIQCEGLTSERDLNMRRRHDLIYTAWTSVVSQFNEPDISTKHGHMSLKSIPNIPPSTSNRPYKRFRSRISTLIDGLRNLQ
jgi:hypothetical protein